MVGNQHVEQTVLTTLHKKSPQTLEFYLEYLKLKEEIVEMSHRLDVQRTFFKEEKVEERQRLQ